jgi:methionine-rich copper-binding protein CopC
MSQTTRVLFALLFLILGATTVHAHAVLTTSSVEGLPVRPDTPATVTLRFNSAVEPGLCQVVLVDAAKAERELTIRGGASASELAVTVPGLTPGPYGLRYKVLAADGHITEDVLRFTVAPAE